MNTINLESLLKSSDEQLSKLNQIVLQSIEEEKLLSEKLLEFEEKERNFLNRLADRIASFGGSWKFITAFFVTVAGWIALNVYFIKDPFDPYPFILLNLFLSLLAAIQAPVIIMSQNRREVRDRKRSVSDYLINLKAEIEVRNLHRKIDLLMAEQIKTLIEIQGVQVDMLGQLEQLISRKDEDKPKG